MGSDDPYVGGVLLKIFGAVRQKKNTPVFPCTSLLLETWGRPSFKKTSCMSLVRYEERWPAGPCLHYVQKLCTPTRAAIMSSTLAYLGIELWEQGMPAHVAG